MTANTFRFAWAGPRVCVEAIFQEGGLMHAGSLALVGTGIGIAALAIALGITFAAPLLAVPFFILGLGAFVILRGKRRSDERRRGTFTSHVPSTEEAAADPVADSSVPDVVRARSDAKLRHEAG